MICTKCSSLSQALKNPTWNYSIEHYSSFVELDYSAKTGCKLCKLFRTVLLEYYSHSFCKTIEEAESYHRSLDSEADWEDCPEADPSLTSDSDSTSDIREPEPTSFFVEPAVQDIDWDSVKLWHRRKLGLHGIRYVRKTLGEDSLPLGKVYPFLDLISLPGIYYNPRNLRLSNSAEDSIALSEWNIVGRQIPHVLDL